MKRRQFLASTAWLASGLPLLPRMTGGTRRFKSRVLPESTNFNVLRVSESVMVVRGKDRSGIPTNTALIVGDYGVAVVDTHQRPSFDQEVIDIISQITDLPVRYLINTHWHQDHTLGNQVFEGRAEIVGHINTLRELRGRVALSLGRQREVLPGQLENARMILVEAKKQGIESNEDLKRLALQVKLDSEYLQELKGIRVVPPTEVFESSYSLDISRQPIKLLHVGYGHTRGDIVVFLPEEGTLVFGDLLTSGQPFMRPQDAVPSAWGPTLSKLQVMDWEYAIPGHGWVDDPRGRIEILVSYLEDLTERVGKAVAAAVPFEEITNSVDLNEYEPYFPYFRYSVGENIRRAYEELQGFKN